MVKMPVERIENELRALLPTALVVSQQAGVNRADTVDRLVRVVMNAVRPHLRPLEPGQASKILNPVPEQPPIGSRVAAEGWPRDAFYVREEGGWVMSRSGWENYLTWRSEPISWPTLAGGHLGRLVLIDPPKED